MEQHNAHVAEYYYRQMLHAEAHYMHGRIAHYRQLYFQVALSLAMLARAEQPSQWAAQHA